MKFFPVVFFVLFVASGYAQNRPTISPDDSPATAAIKEMHWKLRDILNMQLPNSMPDSLNGEVFTKSFTLMYHPDGESYQLEIPMLKRTLETDSIFGGGKYFLPLANIDIENLRIAISDDQQFTSLVIPAKPENSFLFQPYGNYSDQQVPTITIGWYERRQDLTLNRALALWKQFLVKLGE